jgi:hypothetical protein
MRVFDLKLVSALILSNNVMSTYSVSCVLHAIPIATSNFITVIILVQMVMLSPRTLCDLAGVARSAAGQTGFDLRQGKDFVFYPLHPDWF